MEDQIAEINILKSELDKHLPMSEEQQQKLNQKFMLEWNYNSNHIEGNTLTYGETMLLLIQGETAGGHKIREYEEMKAHDLAIKFVEQAAAEEGHELTEVFIRELNKIILKEPFYKNAETADGQPTQKLIEPGKYKTSPNNVKTATGETFFFASVEETPAKMGDLIEWYRSDERAKEHPLEVAAHLHYNFVRIHPFDDGNGRVARLLMNYHLLKSGYPPIIVKTTDKEGYYSVLRRADADEFEPFAVYLANELQWSLDLSVRAAQGKNIEDESDWKKRIDLLARTLEQKRQNEVEELEKIENSRKRSAWRNGLLLKNEFFRLYKPFTKFFDNSSIDFKIKVRSAPNRKIWMEVKGAGDDEFKSIIDGNKFENSILFRVNFSRFKYGADFEFDRKYFLDFKNGHEFIFSAQEFHGGKKKFVMTDSLTENDLKIISDSAGSLLKRIEEETGE